MRKLWFAAVAAAFAAGPVYAACEYPRAPTDIPDGEQATQEQMVAAQKSVRAYNDQISAYVTCLQQEHDKTVAEGGDQLTEDRKREMERVLAQKHNAAIDELQAVATRFNDQVKRFNAKKKS